MSGVELSRRAVVGAGAALVAGVVRAAVPPPQLDEFYSVAEAPLRAAEFAQLGFTEADLWPEDARRL